MIRKPEASAVIRKGQKVRLYCRTKADDVLVSIWGNMGDDDFPYVPAIPVSGDKPDIVRPVYKRFSGEFVFTIKPPENMTIIVKQEAYQLSDIAPIKVSFVYGRFGENLHAIRRYIGNTVRSLCGGHARSGSAS